LEESAKLLNLKSKAIEVELQQSFENSHKSLIHKQRIIDFEVSKLIPLILAIERNSMHGRHLIPSETNVGIILKMKETMEILKQLLTETNSLKIVSSSKVCSLSPTLLILLFA
jgi:hypothetical protein